MVNLFLILNIKEYIQNDESFIILGALNAMMAVGTGRIWSTWVGR